MDVALFGNPNTGKTTLFNQLTDSYAYVGNWSGVTVEKKIGTLSHSDTSVVDLPGIYSLNPLTKDEAVVMRYLTETKPDKILNVVNSAQVKRNLLLTIELLEYGQPLVLIFNMIDVLRKQGIQYDLKQLGDSLHCQIIATNARQKVGIPLLREDLKNSSNQAQSSSEITPLKIDYGDLEPLITSIATLFDAESHFIKAPGRFLALQFLTHNNFLSEELSPRFLAELNACLEKSSYTAISAENEIFNRKQDFIDDVLKKSRIQSQKKIETTRLTARIDRIAVHPFWGFLLFVGIFYLMFKLTFDWIGGPLSDQLDALLSGPITTSATQFLTTYHASAFVKGLIVDGIITGVGGVLVFIPQIFVLFACISFLEDSGYMARSALVMDKLMEKVGLSGKSFIPLIIGFGCNVPGIMAARTIEQPSERLITTLISPFMSCSARLPVYSLFVAAFFEKNQALIILSLYFLGIFVALLLAKIYSLIFKTKENSIFVVELPEYHLPRLGILWQGTWDKGKGFIKKAGTIIFAGTVLIWLLSYYGPGGVASSIDSSFSASIGKWLVPFFAPLGFASWQAISAIMTGILAKEVIGSTMLILFHSSGETALIAQLSNLFSPLGAYSFLVFVLLYIPCFATIGVIKSETNSWKWAIYSIFSSLGIAYFFSFVIFQVGSLLGF